MSMVKYILTLLMIAGISFVILMPKQEFYYTLEETLSMQGIVLNEEEIEEKLFGLRLKNVSVYVKGIYVANIEEINIFTLLFYTQLDLKGLRMDDSLQSLLPQEIQKVLLAHSVVSPLFISVETLGSFGRAEGKINLQERKTELNFTENKNLEMFKSHLTKTEKGWTYEASF